VHRGHARLIERAVRAGRARGLPTVLVTFDPHPARVVAQILGAVNPRDTAALFWHHVTNIEIDLDSDTDGDTAGVRSFLWQPCVLHGVAHVAAGRYTDTVVRVDGRLRYRSKRVSFDHFTPLTDGWDHGRFSLDAARATYPGEPPR
jgi:FAD synthase